MGPVNVADTAKSQILTFPERGRRGHCYLVFEKDLSRRKVVRFDGQIVQLPPPLPSLFAISR